MNTYYVQHFFNTDASDSWGVCCGGAEHLRTTEYPYTLEPIVVPEGYILDDIKKTCKKCECCGAGTTCKDGRCYPTLSGALNACKRARGEQWAWTCDGETQCASTGNTRRLQETSTIA